jgi:hypothetical protein
MNALNINLTRDDDSQVVVTAAPLFNTDAHEPIFVGCYQLAILGNEIGAVCFQPDDKGEWDHTVESLTEEEIERVASLIQNDVRLD